MGLNNNVLKSCQVSFQCWKVIITKINDFLVGHLKKGALKSQKCMPLYSQECAKFKMPCVHKKYVFSTINPQSLKFSNLWGKIHYLFIHIAHNMSQREGAIDHDYFLISSVSGLKISVGSLVMMVIFKLLLFLTIVSCDCEGYSNKYFEVQTKIFNFRKPTNNAASFFS